MTAFADLFIIIIIIIIIGIQPLGRSGQRPKLSQSTGIALVRCILGKFLGVVCHCLPLNDYQIHIKTGLEYVVSVMLIAVLNIKVNCE